MSAHREEKGATPGDPLHAPLPGRGTRILVSTLVGMVEGSYTVAQILAAYPELTEEDVQAALSDGTEGRTHSED